MNENAESAPATSHGSNGEEAPDWRDRYLRLAAEFENFKKRRERETADLRARALDGVVLEMLPSIDHLELALARVPDGTEKAWADGLRHVLASFHDAVVRFGYAPVAPAPGEDYDPLAHEAIDRIPTESAPAQGAVAVVHQRGWKGGGRLLRPARVTVAVPKE